MLGYKAYKIHRICYSNINYEKFGLISVDLFLFLKLLSGRRWKTCESSIKKIILVTVVSKTKSWLYPSDSSGKSDLLNLGRFTKIYQSCCICISYLFCICVSYCCIRTVYWSNKKTPPKILILIRTSSKSQSQM